MKNSAIYAGGERFDRFFKALGDPHRIKILALLRERELSAGEILEAIDIVQSTLSHHMKTLTDAEAVIAVRRGKWTYYSLNGTMMEEASAFLNRYAEGTKERRQETEAPGTGASAVTNNRRKADSEENTAGETAEKSKEESTGKIAEKSKEGSTGKAAAKSGEGSTGKAAADTDRKSVVKDADKGSKKKDKKGKKNKKKK